MKKSFSRQVLSLVLAGAMLGSSLSVPVHAEEKQQVVPKEAQTILGKPETVQIPGSIQDTRKMNFNEGWKFYLGTSSTAQNPGFDDSSWEKVSIPHDFSIKQSHTNRGEAESGYLPGGTGWYRKTFTLPESYEGKRIVLNFDGVYSDAYVYVNGVRVGEHHYGYTAFAFDITEHLKCDGITENVIAVKAVHSLPSSRWYSGSGIYRDVSLITTNQVYVDYCGTQVTTPNLAKGDSTVHVKADIVNNMVTVTNTAPVIKVKHTVFTKAGEIASKTVEQTVNVASGSKQSTEADIAVSDAKLWSVDSPNLYYVRTEVWVDGTLTDSYDTSFGFRYVSYDKSYGFKLNGKNLKLNGVCLHHDQGALGSAAAYDAMYRQLSMMKDMGANAIRTSHNPADEDFIDICNELGLLVIEEAFDGWSISKNGNANDFSKYFKSKVGSANVLGSTSNMTWAEFAIKSMVLRDRNDPSVIMWSLGNEIQEGADAGSDYPQIAQNLINWIKEVDTTRKPTIGSNQRTTSGILGAVHQVVADNNGIVGFNYASAGELNNLSSHYGVLLASETSSAVNSRGIYMGQGSAQDIDGKYHLTSYDTSTVSWGKTAHDSLYDTMTSDHVMGEFVWTGFDYLGEPTPWNYNVYDSSTGLKNSPNSSYFGIVETTGFAKDSYYLYRSQWNQKKNTLHLVTAWDQDNMLVQNGKTPVVIYSNAPEVELYRNGTLIGVAKRTVKTTNAGYQYYTYSVESQNTRMCEAVRASGSSSLYATFNVAFSAGTISAKAYDSNHNLLTDTLGKSSIGTANTPSKLNVQVNRKEMNADGSSLAYISVDVEDSKGNLDTRAENTIQFKLNGNGEIVGVDNGNQSTTDKFQQPTVLKDKTTAEIKAFAGKALVIVRSTKNAGSCTVDVSSKGLTGGSAAIKMNPVDDGQVKEGLVQYTLVRDYTVKVGTKPQFETTATGTMADKSTVPGVITWENIAETMYQTPGHHVVKGTVKFDGVPEPLKITCRLHVIGNVVALQNISTATSQGTIPVLPDKVNGLQADGTVCGEFSVTWNSMSENQFATVGEKILVTGTAKIFGTEELPVTASVRVAEFVNKESKNVAPAASSLSQNIPEEMQSDVLESIRDGIQKPDAVPSERWTNWKNRYTSAQAELTFRWDTAQPMNTLNIFYFHDGCAVVPENVEFEYSTNGNTFIKINSTGEEIESYQNGANYAYTFSEVVSPVALKVIFTQRGGVGSGYCVGVTELEIMSYAGKIEMNTSAELSTLLVDGKQLPGFTSNNYHYQTDGAVISAESSNNAGITILPVHENIVKVVTVSEDGANTLVYEVEMLKAACKHTNTELVKQSSATCTENGYSGDLVCLDCGVVVTEGKIIEATGHSIVIVGKLEPTCEREGYSGDEKCTVCQKVIKQGCLFPSKGHKYNEGVITQQPTTTTEGVKTYTCTVCGKQKTESIPMIPEVGIPKEKPIPTVSAKAISAGRIALTGQFVDYQNKDDYYEVISHGLVFYNSFRLGTKTLSVNTPGRSRVNFTKYGEDGSFTYNLKPSYPATKYAVRAFLCYKDENGKTMYSYSDTIRVSYNGLK